MKISAFAILALVFSGAAGAVVKAGAPAGSYCSISDGREGKSCWSTRSGKGYWSCCLGTAVGSPPPAHRVAPGPYPAQEAPVDTPVAAKPHG